MPDGRTVSCCFSLLKFYVGWPKGWAVFNMAKEIWTDGAAAPIDAKAAHAAEMIFPIGEPNDAYAQYFVGQSYLAPVSSSQVGIFNVTFETGCRNNWHIHHAVADFVPLRFPNEETRKVTLSILCVYGAARAAVFVSDIIKSPF